MTPTYARSREVRNCVVVGAGVIGACTAFRLAEAGVAVTVVDANLPAGGASGASFGWVCASEKGTADYFDLSAAGVGAYRRLEVEWGSLPWFTRSGCLSWVDSPDRQADLVDRVGEHRRRGYLARLLTPTQVRALEPDIVFAASVRHVALYPDEGFVDVPSMVGELLAAAARHGAELRFEDPVVEFEVTEGHVRGVVLRSGARVPCDTAIACCGRWSDSVAGLVGAHVPLVSSAPAGSRAVGLLVLTAPVRSRLGRVIYANGLMARPDHGGRLLLHADEHDRRVRAHTATTPPPREAQALLGTARRSVAGLDDATVERARIGIRALPQDGLPLVGPLSEVNGLYLVLTHSGVTLGPYLGELVSREILGEPQDALRPFRPQRLSGAGTGPS